MKNNYICLSFGHNRNVKLCGSHVILINFHSSHTGGSTSKATSADVSVSALHFYQIWPIPGFTANKHFAHAFRPECNAAIHKKCIEKIIGRCTGTAANSRDTMVSSVNVLHHNLKHTPAFIPVWELVFMTRALSWITNQQFGCFFFYLFLNTTAECRCGKQDRHW